MKLISEIYLTKKNISIDDWNKLIDTICMYNGFLKSFSFIIKNNNNKLSFYVKTNCNLPSSINNLDSFMFKEVNDLDIPNVFYSKLLIKKNNINNIIDYINYFDIKKKGKIDTLKIDIKKAYKKIKYKIYLYVNSNTLKKYKLLFNKPANILAINFENNKIFSYKSDLKYLDIKKITHLLNTDISDSILKVDTFPYLQGDFYIKQNKYDFDKHSLLIGSSGSGKSKFISSIINNIYKNKELNNNYKIVLIDPHASLEEDIGGLGEVIDFSDKSSSVNLFNNSNKDIIANTEILIDLFKSLINDQYNSKLERVLRHSIYLLLTNNSFNFTNLRKIISELDYRNELINKNKDKIPQSTIDFFLTSFSDLKNKYYGEAISPIIAFLDEMEMLPVFNNDNNTYTLNNALKENFLTIFSLDRSLIGNNVTKTISGLIMQQILNIIQRKEINEHIIFIIDEVATIENPILSRFLSEARKYNLSLILASQFFNQISQNLKDSIFANVINYFIFRVSKTDAEILVDNINIKLENDENKEKRKKLLTELNNRECLVRISANDILLPAFKGKTIDFISKPRIKIKNDNIIDEGIEHIKKTNFTIDNNIKLKDILIKNSTNRKENINE